MKKYLTLFLCLIAVIALIITGCGGTHGYGSDAANNNPPIPYELKADEHGAIADTPIGSTGLRFKAEAGTFEPDAKIIITANDSSEGSSNEYLVASTKIYDVKAFLEGTTGSTDILSTEKPVIITLPNDIPGAAEYYLATRASSDSGWNFALITDNNSESNPMNASARMVRAAYGSEFYIALHNLKQQFALFAHKDSSVTPKKAIITTIDCDAPATLKEKDGKYIEDLKVDVVLSVNNASQLKSSDIVLKYNYQNGNSKDAAITATAASLKNTSDGKAKAGSGNKYAHSFELSNFDKFSVSGDKISISFILNMTGVAVEEFAENYYIEVRGNNKDAFELLPGCSCNMTLKSVSDEPSKTDLAVVSTDPLADATNVAVDGSIVITFNIPVFVEDYISMSLFDAEKNLVDCDYQLDSTATILTLTPKSLLVNNAKYNVNISKAALYASADREMKLKENIVFSFTTVTNTVTAQISSKSYTGEGSSALYYPKAVFALTFSQSVDLSNDAIKAAIKLDNNALGSSDTVVYDKSAKVATITFETLFAADSQHTLSFEGMTASDGSIIGEAEALSFKIMPAITASITTPGSTTDVATSTQIVVELSSEASWYEACNIVVSTDSESQSPVNCSSDISGKIYTFTPDNPLNYNKTYYVTVKETTDTTTGISVEKNTFSFTTVANIVTAQISSKSYTGEGSSALYYPKAVFALTFSQSVDLSNDAIKAAIKLDNNALGSSDTVAYDSSAKVATITFDTLFATDSEHGLSFEGMTAGDGSTVEAVSAFSFKIMPAITASLTTPGSTTGVATNTAIVVKLSSAVGESLYSVDNITIKDSDNNIVGLSSTKTVNGAEYTVTPASPLNWLATYTVTVAQDPMTCIPTATQTFTFCTTHNPDFAGGNGTEENPYLIANATHLNNVRKYNYGNNFKQIAHVDLSSFDNWTSISSFSGKYDGDGYKIENLKSSDNGLMDYVTNATFKNINLSVNITKANKNIGGLAATTQNTTIEGCHITGTLNLTISEKAGQNAGFFVGWAKDNSTIKNCYCDGTIESNSTSSGYIGRIGGICGNLLFSPVEIKNCYSNVSISHTGESGTGVTGCLVGANQVSNGSVTNCFSKNSPILGSGSSQNSYSSADGYVVGDGKLATAWDSNIWEIPNTSPCFPTLKCMRE